MEAEGCFERTTEIDLELVEIVSLLGEGEVIPDVFQALEYHITIHPVVDNYIFHFVVSGLSPFLDRLCIQNQDHAPDSFKLQFRTRDLFCSAIPEPVYILKVLLQLLRNTHLPYGMFVGYFGDEFVPGLVSLLRFQEERTKMLAFSILQALGVHYKQLHLAFIEAISNEFASLFTKIPSLLPEESKIDNRSIEWITKFLLLILDSDVFIEQAETFYLQYILPAVISSPSSFSLLILIFCRDFSSCQLYTMRHLCKIYDRGPTSFQVWTIDIVGKIIELHTNTGGAEGIEFYISLIIFKALSSESFIIIDTALNLFGQEPLQSYFKDKIEVILPRCFNRLYKLSKKFWRQEQRLKALEIVEGLVRFNHDIFEACLIEYNRQKLEEPDKETSAMSQGKNG